MTTNVDVFTTWKSVLNGTTAPVRINIRKGKVEWFASPTQPSESLLGHPFNITTDGSLIEAALAAGVTIWMRCIEESTFAKVIFTNKTEVTG